MPHVHHNRPRPAAAVLALLSTSLVLGACGGPPTGGSSSPSKAQRSPSAPTSGGRGQTGPGSKRVPGLRECLQKNGIALPTRPPGGRRPRGAGGFSGGGPFPQLARGVTRAHYRAAI